MTIFPDSKHVPYYLLMIAMFVFAVILVILSGYNKQLQMIIVVTAAGFYIAWGTLHHYLHHTLSPKIVVEYTLMGALGIAIVALLLKGGIV